MVKGGWTDGWQVKDGWQMMVRYAGWCLRRVDGPAGIWDAGKSQPFADDHSAQWQILVGDQQSWWSIYTEGQSRHTLWSIAFNDEEWSMCPMISNMIHMIRAAESCRISSIKSSMIIYATAMASHCQRSTGCPRQLQASVAVYHGNRPVYPGCNLCRSLN